jgi:hypothetical protein
VNSPAIIAKNEYQSLVSPVVRNTGRSSSIHSPQMNTARTPAADTAKATAALRLPANDSKDAPAEQRMAVIAKYMKLSQPIISSDL